MKWTQELLKEWLSFYYLPGKTRKRFQKLWMSNAKFDVYQPFATLPNVLLNTLPEVEKRMLDKVWRWLDTDSDANRDILCRYGSVSSPYPELLAQIEQAPELIFVEGNISLLNTNQLAVVGSRKAPNAALLAIEHCIPDCVRAGITITSGMAMGVDTKAHRTCLDRVGNTVAVLGCGIDQCYPPRARNLRKEIAERGLLVSEYPPGVSAKVEHFPQRNRIISGLSQAVWVVAAAPKSGSLITARLALEQGRDVLALPYGIFDTAGQGCNGLIRQGAKLVTRAADIIEELPTVENERPRPHIDAVEDKQQEMFTTGLAKPEMLANVDFETTPLERVLERSGKTVAQVMNALVSLELDGWIKAVPGGYVRVRR